jgi:chaperonin cofactor prefoldin
MRFFYFMMGLLVNAFAPGGPKAAPRRVTSLASPSEGEDSKKIALPARGADYLTVLPTAAVEEEKKEVATCAAEVAQLEAALATCEAELAADLAKGNEELTKVTQELVSIEGMKLVGFSVFWEKPALEARAGSLREEKNILQNRRNILREKDNILQNRLGDARNRLGDASKSLKEAKAAEYEKGRGVGFEKTVFIQGRGSDKDEDGDEEYELLVQVTFRDQQDLGEYLSGKKGHLIPVDGNLPPTKSDGDDDDGDGGD